MIIAIIIFAVIIIAALTINYYTSTKESPVQSPIPHNAMLGYPGNKCDPKNAKTYGWMISTPRNICDKMGGLYNGTPGPDDITTCHVSLCTGVNPDNFAPTKIGGCKNSSLIGNGGIRVESKNDCDVIGGNYKDGLCNMDWCKNGSWDDYFFYAPYNQCPENTTKVAAITQNPPKPQCIAAGGKLSDTDLKQGANDAWLPCKFDLCRTKEKVL